MTLQYVRVRDKDTGHQYDILAETFDESAHELLDDDRYPPTSRPRAPKHSVPALRPADAADDDADPAASDEPVGPDPAAPDPAPDTTKPPAARRRPNSTPSR